MAETRSPFLTHKKSLSGRRLSPWTELGHNQREHYGTKVPLRIAVESVSGDADKGADQPENQEDC